MYKGFVSKLARKNSIEGKVVRDVNELYSDLKIKVDVKNQARVHLWYEEHLIKKGLVYYMGTGVRFS